MSKVKASVLVIGLFAVIAVAFVGASSYVASSSQNPDPVSMGCDDRVGARSMTSYSAGTCSGVKSASKSCSVARASADEGKRCSVSASCPMAKTGCSKSCGGKSSKAAKIESIKEREGKTLVLVGRYVCGTCQLGVGGDCQPAFQTTDGKNYLLARNNLSKKLRAEWRGKDVEVVSRVRKFDGVKYLEVEVVRAAS